MAQPLNYAQMLEDPDFMMQLQQAMATQSDTPMQPQVQGIEAPSMSASFSMTEMPQSEKEIQAAIRQKFMESQAQQEEQMKQQKALLAQEMERQNQLGVLGRLDLRPFAQALQQYGSTTAVVPTSAPTDRLDAIKQLQEQIQRGQRGLTQDQIGFLRTMMEDKRNAQAGISQKNQEVRMFNYAQGKYLKQADDYTKGAGQYNFVRDEIATGQPSRINRALSQYARIMGQTGVLTDNDIKLQLPPTFVAALDRAYTFITGNPEAALPQDVVNDLLKTLDAGQAATQRAYQNKVNLIHDTFAQSPYAGLSGIENLFKQTTKTIMGESKPMTETKKDTQNKSMIPSSDIFAAEDARRAASKKGKN